MATNNSQIQIGYGFTHGLQQLAPLAIRAFKDPGSSDFAQYGQFWVNLSNIASPRLWVNNGAYNGASIWILLGAGGGADFMSLTVAPGPISLTGTTTVNTSGASNTSIGTGSNTGTVAIGNSTSALVSLAGPIAINSAGTTSTLIGSISNTGTIAIGNALTTAVTILGPTTINSTGVLTTTIGPNGTGSITGTKLYATADAAGVATTNSLSNVVATAAGGGTVTFAANGGGNIVQTGWMKLYAGTTVAYVPYFSAI